MLIQFLFLGSFVIGCHIAGLFFLNPFKEPSPVALTADIYEKEKVVTCAQSLYILFLELY